MQVSSRLPTGNTNALACAVAARRARGAPILDLTVSNPTRVGIQYPTDLLAPLCDVAGLAYEPAALGLDRARAAVAADYQRRGTRVEPGQVVLSASTSEAYGWLFKTYCDPGTAVLVPRPSYPLFEHLTRLEGVRPVPYDLAHHGRWEIDVAAIEAARPDVRAVVAVSPNNPTGSFVSASEFGRLASACAARRWPLILDEVFADYPLDEGMWPTDQGIALSKGLTFTLGGFSKTLGLPQLKLGWIVVAGAEAERQAALSALELVTDSYLSVSTPVQLAAAALLERASEIRDAIRARTRETLGAVREVVGRFPACDLLTAEGGWSAIIQVPDTLGEERLILEALQEDGVLVHPGYFFDFPRAAFVVVSLLPDPGAMASGLKRLLARAVAA